MNKTILGVSFAVAFAAIMMVPAYAGLGNPHLYFDDPGVVVEQNGNNPNNGKSQNAHITVLGDIPVPPNGEDYGWAIPTDKGFVVVTSHPTIGDDSVGQPPENAYHSHFLTASDFESPCDDGNPYVTFATKNEVGLVTIMGDTIWIENVPRGLAGDMQVIGSFSFELESIGDTLCINPVDKIEE